VRSLSNSSYSINAGVGASTFAIATATNQYPVVNGIATAWWPEGPLSNNASFYFYYDEMNNLTREQNILTPQLAVGTRYDALGRQVFWGNTTTTGTDNAAWYSNDGIRPETVYEANLSRPTGSVGIGTWATNGYRRYVLGPNADERLAFIDINGAVSFPHSDRICSTLALSAGTSVTKFRYGPVGIQFSAPI
jgi:hypothetical protein